MKGKLICVTFTLLTILTVFNLAPVEVFAQEDSDLGERIARIEGVLDQMNERLKELNHLGDRIDSLQNSINLRIDQLWFGFVSIMVTVLFAPSIDRYLKKKLGQ